jgi:hypothetical protein
MLEFGGTTMHLPSLLGFKKIGSLAIILVTLWLGGVGCSSCCATGFADACCTGSHKAQNHSVTNNEVATSCEKSPSEKSCCQESQSDHTDLTGTVMQSLGNVGCLLLPAHIEAFTSSFSGIGEFPLQSEVPTLPLALPVLPRTIFNSDTPLIRNRGGTYIQHCALLI